MQAYNSTQNDATGFSPHYLLFGWYPRLSVDAFLGNNQEDDINESPKNYIKAGKLKERMRKAYKVASETASRNSADNKSRYDQKVKENRLEVGDTVLVRKVHHTRKSKMADIWETDHYIITDVPNPEIPVYRVRTVSDKGPVRTLHRNLFLPFNSIPPVDEAFIHDRPRLTRKGPSKKVASVAQSSGSNNSDTDSESSQRYVIPQRRTRQQLRSPRHTMQSSHERLAMNDPSQSEYTDQHNKWRQLSNFFFSR